MLIQSLLHLAGCAVFTALPIFILRASLLRLLLHGVFCLICLVLQTASQPLRQPVMAGTHQCSAQATGRLPPPAGLQKLVHLFLEAGVRALQSRSLLAFLLQLNLLLHDSFCLVLQEKHSIT